MITISTENRVGLATWGLTLLIVASTASGQPTQLFDGKSFEGWEGDTEKVWRIDDGVIHGGSMDGNPRNEFLATERTYADFHLRFDYKLVGTDGFVNGGVQFRSERISDPPNEMRGYQADIGAGYSGSLYDESRRRTFLASAKPEVITKLEKPGDWNHGEVIANGAQIILKINGQRTAIWIEREPSIFSEGKIALQIHGDCKAVISFRNLTIEELPESLIPAPEEVLSRFGKAQPSLPIEPYSDGRFIPQEGDTVVLAGQENLVRLQSSGELEALLVSGYEAAPLRFRSMAWEADTVYEQWRELHFGDWAQQLETIGATVVMAQFGQMEALDGIERLPEFVSSYHRLLDQFSKRTRKLVLISPMPFEKPTASHAPDLTARNNDVKAYSEAIRLIAAQRQAVFVDLSSILTNTPLNERLTDNGIHLTNSGRTQLANVLAKALGARPNPVIDAESLCDAVARKNRLWFDCWRPANWSFVYGDRITSQYGKGADSAPALQISFEQQLPLIEAADARIARIAANEPISQSPVETRPIVAAASIDALSPEEQMETFAVREGFRINLFASEREGVINPTQFAWDAHGRLYVACSPSYPQILASARPIDYILVLEDTDEDGRADRSWRFADNLTMVQGVEPGNGGLYVCDYDKLLHLSDTDGDGRADERRVLFSGFGISDTHQLINSIGHGPDGTLWFSQGLHAMSRVETPWGLARLDRSAIWKLDPRELRLEGYFGGGMAGANCWGVAFDDYGQVFHKSGDRPDGYWSVPGMVRGASPIGSGSTTEANASYRNSPEQYHSVGPLFKADRKSTSIDFIGTKAMPTDLQGCAVVGGYFGNEVQLHRLSDQGAGFKSEQLPNLVTSSNDAFRTVDVSVGPDGALYLADWYNPVIGHYQASYADPRRDKSHGRIWRVTASDRPVVKKPNHPSMTPAQLLDQLRSPERWNRYQAKRLLFDLPSDAVIPAADAWVTKLAEHEEQLLLEVIGVYQAHHEVRPVILDKLLAAEDGRVRAYGARVAGQWANQLQQPLAPLRKAISDPHPRVRLEAVVSASHVTDPRVIEIIARALDHPMDPFLTYAMRQSSRASQARWESYFDEDQLQFASPSQKAYFTKLRNEAPKRASAGERIYQMACLACHQPDGKGLPGVYPPLTNSPWVNGDTDTLIKIVLHGLTGSLSINGQNYGDQPNAVPMPPLVGLKDDEIAEVLTFIRSTYSTNASGVSVDDVARVRGTHADRQTPWATTELMPHD